MQKVQAAAREIDKATSQAADIHSTPKQSETHIVIDQPMFKLGGFLMAGSMGVFGFIGESTMVLILVFFLLLSGDTFKRKLVRLTGPSLSDKKITVHILDDINSSIQSYMFTLLEDFTSFLTWDLPLSRSRREWRATCNLILSGWRWRCRAARWQSRPSLAYSLSPG
jgi:hypothetical protein